MKLFLILLLTLLSSCEKRELTTQEKDEISIIRESCSKNNYKVKYGYLNPRNFGSCKSDKTIIDCGTLTISTINKESCVYSGVVSCHCTVSPSIIYKEKN